MNQFDLTLNKDKDFTIGFGGGSMILTCNKCNKDISSGEVGFPGTKEQQAPIREKFEKIKKVHKCQS
jgi:hypothetical protein